MNSTTLFEKAKYAILNSDEELALAIVEEAADNGVDLLTLLIEGFSKGNDELGEIFERGVISLPELMYAADIMRDITEHILSRLGKSEEEKALFTRKGTILMATVAGDIHDIGKGIVASTLRNSGYQVIDLGCEVPVDEIIKRAEEYDVDIIATSALLTSTMSEQKKLEIELVKRKLKEKYFTMVGGAPCTKRWADKIGAGAYSSDAIDAVKVVNEYINSKTEKKE